MVPSSSLVVRLSYYSFDYYSCDDDDDDDDDDNEDYSCDDDDDDPFHCWRRPKHDVFLSYSNEDVGNGFVSHLKGALQRYGFDISDHTSLPVGQDETSELWKAIEESWICVVVFSEKYPFSVQCLDELVLVMDSISKSNNNNRRIVVPIFYKVDPSHVRSQNHGSFLQAFQAHHDNHEDDERVEKWKHSLKYVGNLAGQEFQTWENEEEFVRKIVIMLGKSKLPIELFDADHPVGIELRAQDLISKLRLDDPDPSITAVLGISGSGKTTLVKAVYDRIVLDFDANCFIEDIRYYKNNVPNWKVDLQREVISRFNGVDYRIHHVSTSSNIRKFVSNRKILLVLDDVDKYEQLQALGIHDPASFAAGSRILVTTTNIQSLSGLKKYTSYNMKLLNHWESSELFTGLAYEEGQSVDEKFVRDIVRLAGGVPLVLEVWGQYFKGHDIKLWPRLLEKLRRIPHGDVQKKLQVSYDSLDYEAKKLFLDIACFFDGMKKDDVIKTLEDENNAFFPDIEIQHLIDRGLVKEDELHYLRMHAVIREMGREVVRQENEDDPGQRSRLMGEDVVRVLRDCSGTHSVRSIYLDENELDLDDEDVVALQVEALRKMSNLRFIYLDVSYYRSLRWNFSNSSLNDEIMSPFCFPFKKGKTEMSPLCFKHLKYLEWWSCPFKSLDMFDMENVVKIRLVGGQLETLWERASKCLKKLRILRVNTVDRLERTGSFIGLENMEELGIHTCTNFKELDGSIVCLQKLVYLDLQVFSDYLLERFPWEMIDKLTSLEHLDLGWYSKLMNISNKLWNLSNISSIRYEFDNTAPYTYYPPNRFNITHRDEGSLLVDSMGGTSKEQVEVSTFPKFEIKIYRCVVEISSERDRPRDIARSIVKVTVDRNVKLPLASFLSFEYIPSFSLSANNMLFLIIILTLSVIFQQYVTFSLCRRDAAALAVAIWMAIAGRR